MYSFVGCDGSICFWQEIEELVSYFVNMHWKIVKIYFESKSINTSSDNHVSIGMLQVLLLCTHLEQPTTVLSETSMDFTVFQFEFDNIFFLLTVFFKTRCFSSCTNVSSRFLYSSKDTTIVNIFFHPYQSIDTC